MKRVLCIILVLVALTVCFASPAFADGEDPLPGEPHQYRHQEWQEAQNGELNGQTETAINRQDWS